jgi:hypothetical protein
MKLTNDQKLDNKLRRKFENEFRNYAFNFSRFNPVTNNGDSSYLFPEMELHFTCFKFGYLYGRKSTK